MMKKKDYKEDCFMKVFWMTYVLWFPLFVISAVIMFYCIKLDGRIKVIEDRPVWGYTPHPK